MAIRIRMQLGKHIRLFTVEEFEVPFNYLYDEFVLDPDIQIGKEYGKVRSLRLAYSPLSSNEPSHYILYWHMWVHPHFVIIGTTPCPR